MRKGSTVLGSLGVISAEIAVLILPLFAAVSGALLAPARPAAAQEPSSPADREAQRAALAQRHVWLEAHDRVVAPVASRRSHPRSHRVPLKVIHTRATWYGPGFHGRRTASGERFDRFAMTLASRHLPMGTRVRVVNPMTGRSAVARVNDRGPFRGGYTADLSQGLARKIGMTASGPVRLEVLAKDDKGGK